MKFFGEEQFENQIFKNLTIISGEVNNVVFTDCVFSHCVFTETAFTGCRFRDCEFVHCDLSLVKVSQTVFTGVQFKDSKIVGVDWTLASWSKSEAFQMIKPISFLDCVLNYSVFIGLQLKEVQIEKCIAKEVDFSDASMIKSSLKGTDLEGAIFRNSDLTESNFVGAQYYFISPQLNNLKGAKFSLPEAVSLLAGLEIVLEDQESIE